MPGDGLDLTEILVGRRKSGKTTLAVELGQRDLALGRWVIVDDHEGHYCVGGCEYYASVDAFRQRARSAAEENVLLPRGVSIPFESAEQALELARQWAELTSDEVVLVVDEGSRFAKSGSTYTGKDLEEFCARARHIGSRRGPDGRPLSKGGVGLRIGVQRPTQIPGSVYEYATTVYLFQYQRAAGLEKIEESMHLADGHLDCAAHLAQHEYLVVKPNTGIQQGGV